jgi:hypothetical protein
MNQDNKPREGGKRPQDQISEDHGSVKGRQRGEDDFKGHSDTPRGSEPQTRGTSGPRH